MTPENHIIKSFRISKEVNDLLNEAYKELGFKKTDIVKFLLHRSLMQLKSDSIQAGGYDKLSITLKEVSR